jgi:hypothetical protein
LKQEHTYYIDMEFFCELMMTPTPVRLPGATRQLYRPYPAQGPWRVCALAYKYIFGLAPGVAVGILRGNTRPTRRDGVIV